MTSNSNKIKAEHDSSFDLFSNLSNEKRNKILHYLLNVNSNLTMISKEINQSPKQP